MFLVTELGIFEPVVGKFVAAVGHVLAAKNAKSQHLFWRQFGLEISVKVSTCGFRQPVGIVLLHQVIDVDPRRFHLGL